MRHTLLAIAFAAASTVASAAFWPFSLFADDASASAVGAPVVSNGVTRTRLGSLYRDNLVVTDVDMAQAGGITNIVPGTNVIVDEPSPRVRRISAVGGVDTNGVNGLIGLYDMTNLTPRIEAKQDLIADLDDIRTGAGLGLTAVQEETDPVWSSRGKYLSVWNATNGLAETSFSDGPYSYVDGDHFIVGAAGDGVSVTNYMPCGLAYTNGVRSSAVETNEVAANDAYVFVGGSWRLFHSYGGAGSFAELSGRPEDNELLGAALDAKASVSTVAELAATVLDHNVTIAVVSNGMARVAETNELLLIRVDGHDTMCDLLERGLTNLENRMPFKAEVRAYSIFDGHFPALRVPYCGDGGGIAFYVLCADGVYRDSTDQQADPGRQPVFSVQSLYGHEFTKERLEELLPGVEWTSGFTLTSANVLLPLSAVCGGGGYPKCYGRVATVYELVLDLAGRDRSLWEDPTARGYADEEADAYVPFSGLERAMNKADAYAAGAYAAVSGLRAEYEEGPAAGRRIGKAIRHVDTSGDVVSLVPDTLTLAVVSNSVSWFAVKYDMAGPLVADERSASCRMAVRCFGHTRIDLLTSQAGDIPFGPQSVELSPGDSIVTVERVARDGGSGLASISAIRLDESAVPVGGIVGAATNAVMSAVTRIVGDASGVLSNRIDEVEESFTAIAAGKLDDDFTSLTNSVAFTNAVAVLIPDSGLDTNGVIRVLDDEGVVRSNEWGMAQLGSGIDVRPSSGVLNMYLHDQYSAYSIAYSPSLPEYGHASDRTWFLAGALPGDSAGRSTLAIGQDAVGSGDASVAVGGMASAYSSGVAVGVTSHAGAGGIAVGWGAYTDFGSALGYFSRAASFGSVAIGSYTFATNNDSVVIGMSSAQMPTGSHGDNTVTFGSTDDPARIYFRDTTLKDMIDSGAAAASTRDLYAMTNAHGASFVQLVSGPYATKAPSEWHPAADPAEYLDIGRVSFSKVFAARVGNELLVSSNGVDWVFTPVAGLTTDVAGCGDGLYAGRFVAGASGGVYAIDSAHPEDATFVPLEHQFRAVFCGIGNHASADGSLYPVWVGVRASDSRLFMSTDAGFNWGDIGISAQLDAVASDGLGSIVGVYGGNRFRRMQIPDGQVTYTDVIPGCSGLVDIACGGGRYVAVCGSSADGAYAYSSDDGVSWSPVYGTPQGFAAITYGSGVFVACEASNGGIWYSHDGLEWVKATNLSGRSGKTLSCGNDRFVCGTDIGVMYCDVPMSNVIPVVQHVVVNGRRLPVGDDNTVSISAVPLSRRINGQSLDGDVWIDTPSDDSLVFDGRWVRTKAGSLVSADAVDAYTKAGAKAMAEAVATAAVLDPDIVRRDSPALTITAPGFNATGVNMGFSVNGTTYGSNAVTVASGATNYTVQLPAGGGTLARLSDAPGGYAAVSNAAMNAYATKDGVSIHDSGVTVSSSEDYVTVSPDSMYFTGPYGSLKLFAHEPVAFEWTAADGIYGETYTLPHYRGSGTLALESWASLSTMLADANTNQAARASCACISSNLCGVVSQTTSFTNAVRAVTDVVDAEDNLVYRVTASEGRFYMTPVSSATPEGE